MVRLLTPQGSMRIALIIAFTATMNNTGPVYDTIYDTYRAGDGTSEGGLFGLNPSRKTIETTPLTSPSKDTFTIFATGTFVTRMKVPTATTIKQYRLFKTKPNVSRNHTSSGAFRA